MNPSPPAGDSSASRSSPFLRRADRMLGPSAAEPEESFDALADLFLGEVHGASATRAKPAATAEAISPSRPVLRLTTDADDDDEPASPQPPQTPADLQPAPPSSRTNAPPSRPNPMTNPVVELLVLGNLPTLASAWASQYAREISAAAKRPVACVRVQGGFATVDLIGEWPGGSGPVSSTLHERLEDALVAAACLTDRWILRCAAGDERPLLSSPMIRVVTVLSGIDEMAQAAAAQSIRALAPALAEPGDDDGPSLRIAVIGAAEEQATEVGRALAAAAEHSVLRPVRHVTCSPRIRSTRSPVGLFTGPSEHDASEVLRLIERIAGAPLNERFEPVRSGATVEPTGPSGAEFDRVAVLVAGDVDEPAVDDAAPLEREQITSAPSLPESTTVVEALKPMPAAPASPASIPSMPMTETKPNVAATVAAAEIGRLAAHVAGLRPIELTCPYAPGIEIAVDSARSLHLLGRAADASTEEATLSALMVASTWAEAHSGLLRAAGVVGEAAPRPTLHLLTDAPKRSRRLLETDVRVHLLAQVTVNGATGWFCTELN